jgi:light-regulated signal transduction histidine kinase (bacteriophytochrome)
VFRAKRFIIRQAVLKGLVERKTKEIRKKNEELEKNDLIKTRLISIISHDIITPLRFLHIAGKNLVEKTNT